MEINEKQETNKILNTNIINRKKQIKMKAVSVLIMMIYILAYASSYISKLATK